MKRSSICSEYEKGPLGASRDRGRRGSEPGPLRPPPPPSPAISHLTPEEIHILQDVFKKQEDFEKSHDSYARRLERELQVLEERVKQQAAQKSKMKHYDLRLCRLCFKTKFADCIGRVCHDCHRRVCNKCGSFVLAKNKQSNKGRWRCYLCRKRREYACLTGVWFHGDEGKPSIDSSDFRRKLSDIINWVETDWDHSDVSFSGSELADLRPSARDAKTDSELATLGDRALTVHDGASPRSCRRLVRRRTTSSGNDEPEEEEENFVDANQFMIERRKCRRERLEHQRRASRRRGSRRGSAIFVGIDDSGSNLDLSPDGRSQTSSMSEQSSRHQPSTRVTEVVGTGTGTGSGGARQRRSSSIVDQGQPLGVVGHEITYASSMKTHTGRERGTTARESHRRSSSGSYVPSSTCSRERGDRERQEQESSSRERHSRSDSRRTSRDVGRSQSASAPGPVTGRSPSVGRRQSRSAAASSSTADRKSHSSSGYAKSHGANGKEPSERRSSQASAGAKAGGGSGGAKKSRPRRPSADASCQISEGDAPLAVLQRVSHMSLMGGGGSGSGSGNGDSPCKKHSNADALLGSGLGSYSTSKSSSPGGQRSPEPKHQRAKSVSPATSPYRKHSDHSIPSAAAAAAVAAASDDRSPRRRMGRQESIIVHASASAKGPYDDEPPPERSPRRSSRPQLRTQGSLNLPHRPCSPPTGAGSVLVDWETRRKTSSGSDIGGHPYDARERCDGERRLSEQFLERRVSGQSFRERLSACSGDDQGTVEDRRRGAVSPSRRSPSRRYSAGNIRSSWMTNNGSSSAAAAASYSSRPAFHRQTSCGPFGVVLHRDPHDTSCRMSGLGMRIMGGKMTADGSLGTFVTNVVKGGPADQNGIRPGDQILEWDGQCLEDATFEEVRQVMDRSGDTVQLVVIHTSMEFNEDKSDAGKESKNIPQWHPNSETRRSIRAAPPRGQKRLLPKTPEDTQRFPLCSNEVEIKKERRGISGRLNLLLRHTSREGRLLVRLARCEGLAPCRKADGDPPTPFARVALLPERSRHTMMHTQPTRSTRDPHLDANFVFENISSKELPGLALEVTLWDSHDDPRVPPSFLGEVLLDLANACLDGSDMWYPLADHDENSGPLPPVGPCGGAGGGGGGGGGGGEEGAAAGVERGDRGNGGGGAAGSASTWRSLPSLPRTPAYDRAKKLLDRRPTDPRYTADGRMENLVLPSEVSESSPQLYKRRISPVNMQSHEEGNAKTKPISSSTSTPENLALRDKNEATAQSGRSRPPLKVRMMRQMSDAVNKVSAKLADKRSHSLDSSSEGGKVSTLGVPEDDSARRHSTSGIERSNHHDRKHAGTTPAINLELLSAPMPVSRSSSQSSGSRYIPTDSEFDDSCYSASPKISAMLDELNMPPSMGPGQISAKRSFYDDVDGRETASIQLGLVITKGQMEVDVVRAQGLPYPKSKPPPDTYVKLSLLDGTRRMQQKKTKVAKCSLDPLYHQQIKYPACNIHGRHLQIQVKEKSGRFEKSLCLGEVVIRLDSLDLSRKTTGWYRLFGRGEVEVGSTESLHIYSP